MKAINEMHLRFQSKSSNESFARVAVSSFISSLDPTIDEISEIKTAVSEAVTNCIVHGYRNTLGTVYINVRIYENGKIIMVIKDKGCGIEDVETAMQPLYTSDNSGERAGMGFTIMQSFMNKFRVRTRTGKGTTVILEKTLTLKTK